MVRRRHHTPSPLALLVLLLTSCEGASTEPFSKPDVPLDADAPWPKFRANSKQDGRVNITPADSGMSPWVFQTGKGVFSTPVIDGSGNIYVGSADRTFYSIDAAGTERWRLETGEIIDSSALLDDAGNVYFGSGDGHVYALDRKDGTVLWTFEADDPSVNDAFIRWFEGNIAITADGSLIAPNDNFCTYAIDRETGSKRWCYKTSDQTWSLPAVDAAANVLYMGNNYLLGLNVHAFDGSDASVVWTQSILGATMAASPMLMTRGETQLVVIGGFDGYVRAFETEGGGATWTFGARDHLYASPGRLSDGTVVQPSADGTIYGLNPDDGTVRWAFDTLEPIRSSPAIDAEDHIYVGSGEGKLFVLNKDGTLRFSIKLIEDERNDLNASVALGKNGAVIAGENGGVYFVPYDYCLRTGLADARCSLGGEALPDDLATLLPTSRFGAPSVEAPPPIAPNEPLVFSLFVREAGDTVLSVIDSETVDVTVDPPADVRVDVSGDRKFLTIVPTTRFEGDANGRVHVTLSADYLVDLERAGLKLDAGVKGGTLQETFDFELTEPSSGALALPIPAAPGDDAGELVLSRIAAPLPTILPSYNQIGFDSIHYLVGLVEGTPNKAIAWGIGAVPSGDTTVVDPSSNVRFPLVVSYDAGLLSLENEQRFTIEFNGFPLPFESFRVRAVTDETGHATRSPAIVARAICGDIDFYGAFLQALGFCNPTTDVLLATGALELGPNGSGIVSAPTGLGTITTSVDGSTVVATLVDSTLSSTEHNVSILLVDAATGEPINANYVEGLTREESGGVLTALRQDATGTTGDVRAYVMVDTYPAFVSTVTLQ
ncbi:MAG: PQQ-binding-like beta-propeller repeat protein [Polyangiaceae bacterium]